MKVSIGVKALNEEQHIAASLASAVAAVAPFDGEVILADSGSTDRTLEIARAFPVRIVQLADLTERSCGAGAQLAFQHATGDFFYLLDGDMVLDPDFLPAGLERLTADPTLAAVGGRVAERNTVGAEFQIRANAVAKDRNWLPGEVDRLDCGGLYRMDALREVGYFADRNLHAFEEFELGARLQSHGWKLARIDKPAVDHFGHTIGGYKLMWKRIKSGYSGAPGEVLRGAIGKRHMPVVLRKLSHIRVGAAVIAWWALLIAALFTPHPFVAAAILVLAPLVFLVFRRRSLPLGVYSLIVWNVSTWGLISGFFRPRVPPQKPLAAVDLQTPASSTPLEAR